MAGPGPTVSRETSPPCASVSLSAFSSSVFVVAVGLELAALRALVCLEPLGAHDGHRLDEHDDVQAAYQGARFQSSRPDEPSVALKYSVLATTVR